MTDKCPDWDEIERLYRIGIPFRAIAAMDCAAGISFKTIHKRSKVRSWVRNDGAAVHYTDGNNGCATVNPKPKKIKADKPKADITSPGCHPFSPSPYRSKEEALSSGARYFFTGEACQNGHYANRDAKVNGSGVCYACLMATRKKKHTQAIEFPEEAEKLTLAKNAAWAAEVPDGLSPYKNKAEARDAGSPTYFTGVACIRGHLSNKSVATGNCLECKSEDQSARRLSKTPEELANIRRKEAESQARKRSKAYDDLVAKHPGVSPYRYRSDAIAAGSEFYFSGKPCPHGHVTNHKVSNGECVDCADMRNDANEGRLYKIWMDKELAYQSAKAEAKKNTSHHRTRVSAVDAGSDVYFTGVPCQNNHLDDRVVSRGNQCASCLDIWDQPKPPGYYGEQERRMKESDPIKYAARVRAKRHKRKAAEKMADGSFSRDEFLSVVDGQNGMCFWCGVELDGNLHADHYIPLSRGGTNWITNIVAACPKCNLDKSAKMPWDFAAEIGRTDITPDMVEPRQQCCHAPH